MPKGIKHHRKILEKPKINMTSMIDVVFLLLSFFVITFKIIVPEGDFDVQMSPAGQAGAVEQADEPVHVRLVAQEDGELSAIMLNDENIENLNLLRQRVSTMSRQNADLEVILHLDEHLWYEYVIQAFTAVNGEFHEGHIRKISSNIKFARVQQ